MEKPRSSVTVADVARAASVSKATAARVLGGYGKASEAARFAVVTAAAALGYRHNELARAMSRGRSDLIGVVVADIENAFFGQAVRGMGDAAREAGFGLVITNSGEALEDERALVAMLLRQRVAGLIVSPADDRSAGHLQAALDAGVPVVTLDRHVPDLDADAVCGDDLAAAGAVTRHLLDAGHSRIAYISAIQGEGGRVANLSTIPISAVRERIEGYANLMGAAGSLELVRTDAVDQAATDRIVAELAAERPQVTAILASDSLVGARVFRALMTQGLAVPERMSLVSWFDGDWTQVTSPAISVVDQPTYRFGREAVQRLTGRINMNSGPAAIIRITTPFVQRGSIARLPNVGRG